jgi:hypothetical protein
MSAVRVHTVGTCSAVGLGDGDGDGDATGLGDGDGLFVGVVPGCVPPGSVVPVPGSVVTGGVVVVPPGVVGVSPVVVVVVGDVVVVVVVPFDARSPTLRVMFGTLSSKTRLLMVISPEPVTSIETSSMLFFNRIETC